MMLFAAVGPETQVVHQFGRFHTMTEWWQWFVVIAVAIVLLVYAAVMYRKDSVEIPRGLSWALFFLRFIALAGILFFFLDLEKREERRIVRNSRVAVMVDTSLSMGIQDSGSSSNQRRIDPVIEEFARRDLLEKLRENHDVVVYRFDQQATPSEIVSLPRVPRAADSESTQTSTSMADALAEARKIAIAAAVLFGIALVSLIIYLIWGRRKPKPARAFHASKREELTERDGSWSLLVSMVAAIAAVAVLSVASLRHPELEFAAILGAEPRTTDEPADQADEKTDDEAATKRSKDVAWNDELSPRGAETRLGDAVRYVINKERGGPIAGIVVISDGGANAGSDYQESVAAARSAGVRIFCIGIGSDRRPTNVRIADLEAPPRVYPGDAFQLTGYLQAFGLSGRSLKVELTSQTGKDPQAEKTIEDTQQAVVGPDGELVPLKFEVTPKQAGVKTYTLRVLPPSQDSDDRDNEKSAAVQVIERKNRVLLFAGAATRDFQFLRNMLFRDKDTTVDVLLQSGTPGISQEADELLFEFPSLAEEIFEYDCIVAIDPDWTKLSDEQADLLERWVAEKAGGLILIAGIVETPKLMGSRSGGSNLQTVRGLYPVIFFDRSSATLSLSRMASETPWPLTFTREGQESEFLRLEDDPVANEEAWASYPGIYGYFAVKDPKPGAKVFATFSDPAAAIDDKQPIYLAAHFYGAGRVIFQGSGEMWRLREVSDAYFERYYTKLIRWVSQGRLLRDSSRGLLLVDKDRCLLGETISVQAVLTNAQHDPLDVAEVMAVLVQPDGRRQNLPLRQVEDAARAGSFSAQFTAALEGDYRIELPMPDSAAGELLSREVRARIPALETERPERNDALLTDFSQKTGGLYYVGLDSAMNRGTSTTPLATSVEPQDQITYLPGTPDKDFDRLLMTWLMAIICGALFLEWLVRRLVKLA